MGVPMRRRHSRQRIRRPFMTTNKCCFFLRSINTCVEIQTLLPAC
ncbi:hypothetical protein DK45_4107 [Bordetella bronchiseptica]|nr:hypothetical protein DK45_4107 [Bordetella bronchiseptica]